MSEWLIVARTVQNWPIGQTTEITARSRSRSRAVGSGQGKHCYAGAQRGVNGGMGEGVVWCTFKFMCNLTLQNWVQRTQRSALGATSKRRPPTAVSSIRHGNRKRDLECLPDCMPWPNCHYLCTSATVRLCNSLALPLPPALQQQRQRRNSNNARQNDNNKDAGLPA